VSDTTLAVVFFVLEQLMNAALEKSIAAVSNTALLAEDRIITFPPWFFENAYPPRD
jgi:hypothetical protein